MLACTGLLCLLAGCKVYDDGLLPAGAGGRSGAGGGRAGMGGDAADACVMSVEVCNNLDDDCNGVVDDPELTDAECSERYHARVECGRGGFCLFMPSNPMCDPGWYHCDGVPQNGCESQMPCACTNCPQDGGSDDGGADDGGAAE